MISVYSEVVQKEYKGNYDCLGKVINGELFKQQNSDYTNNYLHIHLGTSGGVIVCKQD